VVTEFIPRINDDPDDFNILFNIWNKYQNSRQLELDFSTCDFLRQNAVAFLGGMISYIKSNGGLVTIKTDTLIPALQANLEQNGFLFAMGEDVDSWDGNSIPYREDRKPDYQKISRYLQEKWIGKGWLNIQPELAHEIVSNVLEIYFNAFTHGYSPNGVYSCGQNFPYLEKLKISAVDFGIGIPQSVRDFLYSTGKPNTISDDAALQLAFKKGFSTRPDLGGMGLKLLKEFIQVNQGQLDIYSHSGHAIIDAHGERYERIDSFFKGTIVNISINRDQKFYYLTTEKTN
jgi:signal transduction histidine kinase